MNRILLPGGMFAAMLLVASAHAEAQPQSAVQQKQPTTLFTHKNVEQAWKAAAVGRKPLVVMFTSDNCIYCKKMLKKTYRHPTIEKMLLGNTETVLAHANQYRDLVKKLGIRGYPTTMIISPDGKVLELMPGYVEPKAFAQRIHPILLKERAAREGANSTVAANTGSR